MDGGAWLTAPALAAALPLVLWNHAVDVEAQALGDRERGVRQVRPAMPGLPGFLPGTAAADRARGRPRRDLRPDLPQPGDSRRVLARVQRAPAHGVRIRAAYRPGAAADDVGAAAAAGGVPAADVPGHHPVGDD